MQKPILLKWPLLVSVLPVLMALAGCADAGKVGGEPIKEVVVSPEKLRLPKMPPLQKLAPGMPAAPVMSVPKMAPKPKMPTDLVGSATPKPITPKPQKKP